MMTQFDNRYWEARWAPPMNSAFHSLPPNPYVQSETTDLRPTTALDAGCGAGSEAMWLAEQGWRVTAADISEKALEMARARSTAAGLGGRIEWIEADLSHWEPARTWDLVVTSYAHSELSQLEFYRRIASWVAPGGTLLIVGHLHGAEHHGQDHPEAATATLPGIVSLFVEPDWLIEAAYDNTRTSHPGGNAGHLRDVIVRARRLHPEGSG